MKFTAKIKRNENESVADAVKRTCNPTEVSTSLDGVMIRRWDGTFFAPLKVAAAPTSFTLKFNTEFDGGE